MRTASSVSTGGSTRAQWSPSSITCYKGEALNHWSSLARRARLTSARASSMGIGFTSDEDSSFVETRKVVSPKYGLSVQQMHVLGLTPDGLTKVPEVELVGGFCVRQAPFVHSVSTGF